MFAFPLLVQFDLVLFYDRIELRLCGAHFPLLRFVLVQPVIQIQTFRMLSYLSVVKSNFYLLPHALQKKLSFCLYSYVSSISVRHRKLFRTLSLISIYHSRDFFASSNRPLETSHTGDSGTKNCTKIIGTTA